MQDWYWSKGILVCGLLCQWRHGFFTRSHGSQMPIDLQIAFYREGQAYHAKQVHGNRIVNIAEISDKNRPEADGVIAIGNIPNTSVWTCTADCVPVLVGDRTLGTVAAVHAGWQGTAKEIVPNAIALFLAHGSQLSDLVIALGPAIGGKSYQVQSQVADQVLSTIKHSVGVQPDPKPNHARLDIRLVQQQQLIELGINSSQIAIAPYCTFQTPEHFFSYRRYTTLEAPNNPSGQVTGTQVRKSPHLQWSGIASN